MLVIGGIEAPVRRRRGVRPRRASEERATVEVTRATVIDAAPLGELDAANAWLARATGDDAERIAAEALAVLNQAVAGHRLAAADPWLADADPTRALVIRVGYGTGEQVADGDWESARELPVPATRAERSALLSPHERVAALLDGRDVALACEELALRARGDLDHGRPREAALQLVIALDAALAELEVWRDMADMTARLEELAGWRAAVGEAATAALQGGLSPTDAAAVSSALARLEAALRARLVVVGGARQLRLRTATRRLTSYSAARRAASSSSTSPSSRTAAKRSNGVSLRVTTAI